MSDEPEYKIAEPGRSVLTIALLNTATGRWEARAGALGTGYGETVIGALEDLVESMRRDAERGVDEVLERSRREAG